MWKTAKDSGQWTPRAFYFFFCSVATHVSLMAEAYYDSPIFFLFASFSFFCDALFSLSRACARARIFPLPLW